VESGEERERRGRGNSALPLSAFGPSGSNRIDSIQGFPLNGPPWPNKGKGEGVGN
jgi:hypothetical protein